MATQNPSHDTKIKLRREVTVWGSFCWGYADIGADVYVALGLVIAAAHGATPLAFAIAGIAYVFVGVTGDTKLQKDDTVVALNQPSALDVLRKALLG